MAVVGRAPIASGVAFVTWRIARAVGRARIQRGREAAPRARLRQLLDRGVDGPADRDRQGRARPAGLRPVERLRPRPYGRDRVGDDDGRGRGLPAAADDVSVEDARRIGRSTRARSCSRLACWACSPRCSSGADGRSCSASRSRPASPRFACHVVWMMRRPAPRPPGARRPDFAVLHAAGAGVSLVAAVAIGLTLLVAPPSVADAARWPRRTGCWALSASSRRWSSRWRRGCCRWPRGSGRTRAAATPERPPSPHVMRDRVLQADRVRGLVRRRAGARGRHVSGIGDARRPGAWALFAGVAITTLDNVFVILRADPILPP